MFLKDRLFEQSDPYLTVLCTKCGFLAEPSRPPGKERMGLTDKAAYCRYCKSSDNVVDIKIPYAFKVFVQECFAGGGAIRLHLDKPAQGDNGDGHQDEAEEEVGAVFYPLGVDSGKPLEEQQCYAVKLPPPMEE